MESKERRWCPNVAAPLLSLAFGSQLFAQDARLKPALDALKTTNAWTLEQQVSICEIPSPPFKEGVRAAEYKRRLEALGLTSVRIDAEGNVIAERKGSGGGPTVVVSAHLDTVFPEGTDVKVKSAGGRLTAPGITDDCRGLATLLAVAKALNAAKVQTKGTILFVGTVGEEGAGNLRGVRHLFTTELKGKVDYFISVDGAGFGVTSRAVGSNRYRVTYRGSGGHSYGDFGIPNPVHALGRAIALIGDLEVPDRPKTTFSVGVVKGGTSVNAIAGEASMEVDMRSESVQELVNLDSMFRNRVQQARYLENNRWENGQRITYTIDTIGIRPTGSAQADTAKIVRTALAALQALGRPAPETNASSTDANFPMSLGIPAITMDAGGTSEGTHSLSEWYEDGVDGYVGPQWVLMTVTSLAELAPGI